MIEDNKYILTKSQKLNIWNSQKIYYSVAKDEQKKWTVKRNEVYFVDLGENIGNEENKIRPVVVIQANTYSFKSPVIIVAIISSSKLTIPDIQIQLTGNYMYKDKNNNNMLLKGIIDLGQIRTIGKERIISKKICQLNKEVPEIDSKLLNIFGLNGMIRKKDNVIDSLNGKINFLKKQLENKYLKKQLENKSWHLVICKVLSY